MADNKSSLVQIAQAVLDQTEQAIKVTGNITVPPPVGASTLAEQEAQTDELIAIKGYVDGIEGKLDTLVTQTDGVEGSLSSINTKASTLSVVGSGAAATALRVQLADESLSALENISVTVTNTALEITNDAGSPIPISGTVNANTGLSQPLTDSQLRASAVPVSVASLPLPAGASTEATLLDIKSNTVRLNYVERAIIDYSSTNVNSLNWTQLIASTTASIKEIEIFDSSGEILELGIGVSLSEVSKIYVIPGGNGRIPLQISAGSRLAIKAVSATANSGHIVINLYG